MAKLIIKNNMVIILLLLVFNANYTYSDDTYRKEMDKIAKKHLESSIKFYRESRISEAKIELQKAMNLDADNNEASDLMKKITDEEFVAAKDEKFVDTVKEFYESGMRYYRKEEYNKVLKEFEKALALNPKQEKTLKFYNEIREKLKIQPLKEAIVPTVAKNSIKLKSKKHKQKNDGIAKSKSEDDKSDKKRSSEFHRKGLVNYKKGKFEDAIFCFEQALKLNPSNLRAKKSLERAKLKAGLIK